MRSINKLFIFLCLGGFILQSCNKDESHGSEAFLTDGVFVINEGGFGKGTASVTYADNIQDSIIQELFFKVNNLPLGDVAQEMIIEGSTAYIVINGSGKIDVVDLNTFGGKATITGFKSPRNFLKVGNDKAYVTDYTNNGIYIVSLSSNTITGEIPASGWTEDMILINNKVFVGNPGDKKILIIDPVKDSLEDSVTVPAGGGEMAQDANGNIWVLCTGDFGDGLPRNLVRLNTSGTIQQTIPFNDPSAYITDLLISEDGTSLYFLYNDIYKMSITDNQIPAAPFIASGGRSFYSLGIEPGTSKLYVGNAADYISNGWALLYNEDTGTLTDSFRTGIIPGAFAFL